MPDRGFLEFMDDPIDWFEEAARLTRLHAAKLAGHDPKAVDRVSAAPAGEQPSCSVIVLDSRRKTA